MRMTYFDRKWNAVVFVNLRKTGVARNGPCPREGAGRDMRFIFRSRSFENLGEPHT